MLTYQFVHNDWLRGLMLTRGWKVYDVHAMLNDCYALNTIRKWHSRAKPMPTRARELIELRLNNSGEGAMDGD